MNKATFTSTVGYNQRNVTNVIMTTTAPQGNVSGSPLHPGFTTLISFAAAILLVLIYLYFENLTLCVRRLCLKSKFDLKSTDYQGRRSTVDVERCENGDLPSHAKSKETDSKMEEPGVLCDCGQIHLLRECISEKDLRTYRDLLAQIDAKKVHQKVSRVRSADIQQTSSKSTSLFPERPNETTIFGLTGRSLPSSPTTPRHQNELYSSCPKVTITTAENVI